MRAHDRACSGQDRLNPERSLEAQTVVCRSHLAVIGKSVLLSVCKCRDNEPFSVELRERTHARTPSIEAPNSEVRVIVNTVS